MLGGRRDRGIIEIAIRGIAITSSDEADADAPVITADASTADYATNATYYRHPRSFRYIYIFYPVQKKDVQVVVCRT